MTSPNNNSNRNWTDMVAASRKEVPSPVDVRDGVRAELESMLKAGTLSWTDMVAASRKEVPSPVDVRYGVRAQLERMLRKGRVFENQSTDWINALVSLFNPGIVKLGLAAAFVCMVAVEFSISTSEVETESEDPLVSLYSGEGEWSDWL
ncbi:MAG: hypothetical protein O3C20_13960 [Verrucomicrobia bacterium]|nr:hypothetical protein [Verrucomicrobiota bacterium]